MIHIIYPKNTVFYSIVLSGRSSIVDRALSFILDQISSFDHNVLASVNYFMRNRIMDAIMPYVTKLADNGVIWIALALILLIPKKTRRTGAAMGVALLIGLIVGNGLIKNLVARPRPFNIPDTVLSKNGLLIEPPPTIHSRRVILSQALKQQPRSTRIIPFTALWLLFWRFS